MLWFTSVLGGGKAEYSHLLLRLPWFWCWALTRFTPLTLDTRLDEAKAVQSLWLAASASARSRDLPEMFIEVEMTNSLNQIFIINLEWVCWIGVLSVTIK